MFFFVLLFPVFYSGFDLVFHLHQHCKGLLVVGEQEFQQGNGNGQGDDLLRGDGQPQKSHIAAAHSHHPADPKIGAQSKQDVRPAVGDQPGDAKAQQKPGIQTEHSDLFQPVFDLFCHSVPTLLCVYRNGTIIVCFFSPVKGSPLRDTEHYAAREDFAATPIDKLF